MEKFIKDNILYLLIVVIVFFGCLYGVFTLGATLFNNGSELRSKNEELESQKAKLEQIKAQKISAAQKEEKKNENAKVIYEVLGQQFSPEASFGIMFENILANMTNSGLRIHSIDYNYSPADDLVLQANAPGYNACELSFTTIGNYSQLQTFFKNLAKETYLTEINEVYIEPYDKDKTILISRFKVRLYTKTI